jgi:signal transduction histidine kinase
MDILKENEKRKKPLILIVDDNSRNLQVLGNILRAEDTEIAVAINGEQALSIAFDLNPDLILLDIMMPDLDGFEVCTRLKAEESMRDTPIIFLTAKTEIDDIVKGFQLGAVDYVTKPFNGAELLSRVKTHLELRSAREELKRINSTKDKFFSIIAHDLKNPFNAIMGFGEILITDFKEMPDDEKLYFIRNMAEAAQSSYALLENLLQWSRSQTGRLQFNPELIQLSELIEETIRLVSVNAYGKSITLENEVDSSVIINADKEMLRTILRNLLTNSIKFTKENGKISVSAEKQKDMISITVSDNGVGIKPKDIDKLFRIDTNITTIGTGKERGTGLGLILCKEFVERHGGEIGVESTFGAGSDFSFTIPAGD